MTIIIDVENPKCLMHNSEKLILTSVDYIKIISIRIIQLSVLANTVFIRSLNAIGVCNKLYSISVLIKSL